MSDVEWPKLAKAVSCSLEWERLCDRSKFLDENSLHRSVAEYLQSVTTEKIEAEYGHQDLPGEQRLDLVGFGPQHIVIDFAVEAKWIRDGGGVRDWPAEVTDDIFRLEMLSNEMAQQNERIIVVSGVAARISAGLLKKGKNVKGQNRLKWIDELLPTVITGVQRKTEVRDCKVAMKDFFKKRALAIGVQQLPISFQAQLLAEWTVDVKDTHSIATYVWRISRSQNRTLFTP